LDFSYTGMVKDLGGLVEGYSHLEAQ